IGALGDVHGYLRAPERAEALGRAPVSNARTGRPPIPPEGRLLPGRIGYVTVPGFAGGTHMQQVEFAETLQSLLRSLDADADGAWHREGAAGLGDFARLRVRGEAYRLRDPDARVAVLVGPDTASAGEVLAMAFRGADGRRSFGARTGGVNTGTRTFVLPDGAELVLAVVTMSDRTGRAYRGPIEPDVAVEPGRRDVPLADQPEVRAAVGWLADGC